MARYTLRQLECFVAVGEHGSIAAAAQALMLSPSAVTGALNELERIFGAQLTIRRKAHGVTLTPSGGYVLSQARSLLSSANDLQTLAGSAGTELRGRLVVGCYSSLAPTLLTGLLAEFTAEHPRVDIEFHAGTQAEIHRMLLSGELDVAIAYDLAVPAGVAKRKLMDSVPSVVLPADHRLAGHSRVALAELVSEPMILLDVNPSRENTEMMFSAAGLEPWIRFRTTDFEVTRSMVARGMGYAILVQRPAGDVSYEGRPLVVLPIHPAIRHVPVSMVWPESTRLSGAAEAMLALAERLHGSGRAAPSV
ncbi:LysR substrate-binding domain-containing protein [Paeniglutamicibacter cryotolerans]|uniref:DNA-binding transcriptional LysR family regulator n=1 Tax=Paeniglutamicibacter cryotolerans TaxID=670079 RepID=A0A839QMN7_9MICC|nr:LysR substrate-binding domain-containing protein [Paeniglutamicibacter cryotolerans]MBB2995865.1 DNA-binding transcriptional LysR family regulator [Paeniglutamicibacter cryotolerans]